jgi:hypothetical protein
MVRSLLRLDGFVGKLPFIAHLAPDVAGVK